MSNYLTANHIQKDRASIELMIMQVPFMQRASVIDSYDKKFLRDSITDAMGQVWECEHARQEANDYLLGVVTSGVTQYLDMSGEKSYVFPRFVKPMQLKDHGAFHALECKKRVDSNGHEAGFIYCTEQGIDKPYVNGAARKATDRNSLPSAIKRMTDGKWWTRKLVIKYRREAEHVRIKDGVTQYCSDVCAESYINRIKSGEDYMKSMIMVSDDGDEIPMLDILAKSTSNPEIRRVEFMVRLYGFDKYASDHGDVCEFYTITAPSKYHPNSKKYEGFSPRETHQNLMRVWARARAKLARNNLEVYGFRIIEPHKDACGHIHMVLFMNPSEREAINDILRDYFLDEDIDELKNTKGDWLTVKDRKNGGRKPKHTVRFDSESIPVGTGAVIAYLAKYVGKNINGAGVDVDHETGLDASVSSLRVRAWASIWGIRQFQQIGGSKVGVWRESRRLDASQTDHDAALEVCRAAVMLVTGRLLWSLKVELQRRLWQKVES